MKVLSKDPTSILEKNLEHCTQIVGPVALLPSNFRFFPVEMFSLS